MAGRHTGAVNAVTADALRDCALVPLDPTVHERDIFLLHFAGRELRCQFAMRFVVLCHDDQSAGFFVEAVDNPGTQFSAYAGQTYKMVQQSIHQRATIVIALGWARAGVDHHSRRLVDYGKIVVFVADVEWDIFGDRAQRRTLSVTEHADALTSAQFERSLGRCIIHQHFFCGDQFLHARAAYAI